MSTAFNVMPPSPGSKRTEVTAHYAEDHLGEVTIKWACSHDLHEETRQLLKELPIQQVNHRGRVCTIASNMLLVNEWNRRVAKTKEALAEVPGAALTESESKSLAEKFAAINRKYLVYKPELIDKYKVAHKHSSAVPGIKWIDTPDGSDEIWQELFDWTAKFMEDWEAGLLYGKLLARPFWSGIRARNKTPIGRRSLPSNPVHWNGTDDRSRTVNFLIGFSSVTAFIEDKKSWYRDVLQLFRDEINPPNGGGRRISPLVEGGEIYEIVAESLQNRSSEPVVCELGDDCNIIIDGEIQPYDMNACEAITGHTLGRGFWPCLTTAGGFAQLPSGIWATTALDIATTQCFQKEVGWLKGNDATLEFQEADYKSQFLLGLRFKEDPLRPRFQGVKLSGDSAEKGVSVKPNDSIVLKGSHGTEVVTRWCDAYRGIGHDGESLLASVKRIDSGLDFFDPSTLVTQAVL
jgi:hypothetical protein